MPTRTDIPTYDLCKTLEAGQSFELTRLEESYQPYDASAPHRHNYFEVLFFKEGGGWHEVDFNSFPVKAASLHFVTPGQVHVLRREKSVTGFVVAFTQDFFHDPIVRRGFLEGLPFFDNPFSLPVVSLEGSPLAEAAELFLRMQAEYEAAHTDRDEMLRAYLSALFILARRSYDIGSSAVRVAARSEMTHKFKKLVDEQFRTNKLVNEYAALLAITAGHLNDTVQKETGKTASEVIHERIILEAKRLLYHSPKSVKEIAFDLNYEDPSHFTRFFKTHAGTTPEQFRNQIREKYH